MKARAGQVGAMAGNLWNGSRAHMKASVAMLGHIWDKGRTHEGQGQDTFVTRVGKWEQRQGMCGARAGNMVVSRGHGTLWGHQARRHTLKKGKADARQNPYEGKGRASVGTREGRMWREGMAYT